MKKILFLLSLFVIFSCSSSEEEEKVPGTFKTNVLVEDITGTWCGWCPRVAYKLQELQKTTSQLIVVAAHYGSSGTLDYEKVNEIKSTFGVSSYPYAILNRSSKWNEQDSQITSLTGVAATAGVAIESAINNTNLTVTIKVGFSQDFTNLKYVIYLLENGLLADQANYADLGYGPANPLVDFEHKHVLRKALTSDPLGDAIPDASSTNGSIFKETHTYTIPAEWNKDKMEIVAFVVKSDKSVINARHSDFGNTQTFQALSD